ncbi:MAG: PAS domain S-box protein [Methanofollis liminatans]|nr:PAS domain S-box protein [Methanofollis liminatans]
MAVISVLCLSASREGEPGPAGDEEIVVTTADTLEDLLNLAASRPFDVVMIPADLALTPVLNLLEAPGGAPPLVVASSEKGTFIIDFRAHDRSEGGIAPTVREAYRARMAERDLQERERQLSTLLSNLPGMAYRCDNGPDYTMTFVSEGCFDLLGYAPGDLVGSRTVAYGDLIHPDDRAMVWEEIQKALKERGAFRITYRIRKASGDERWVWEQGRGIFARDGSLLSLEGFIADVTYLVLTTEQLRRRELEEKAILDNIPDIAWLKDGDGRYIAVNRAFEQAAGKTADELVGRTDREIWPGYIAERYMSEDREVIASGKRALFIEPFVRGDGLEILVETVKTPIYDHNGRAAGTAGICRDITARRAMEEALRKSEERHRIFLQNFPGIAFKADPGLHPLWLSGNVEGITGYTADEIVSAWVGVDNYLHPGDLESGREFLEEILTSGKESAADFRIVRKDGAIRWGHIRAQAVRDAEGRETSIQGAIFDVTEQKEAVAKIRDLAKFPEENPGPVMRISRGGRILYANGASRDLLKTWGTEEGGVLPETWREVVASSLSSERIKRRDVAVDGSDFTITCVPVAGADYANLYGIEITERKVMEIAVQDANRKLNLLNSIIRHDMLNQITVLQGYIDLTRQSGEGGPHLGRIADATERIRRQVEFTRDYQELGVKGPIWQDACAAMKKAFASLSPPGISLDCTIGPGLEVLADPLLGRVFYNLVENTVRHGTGAQTIRFSAEASSGGISLVYEDDGQGIPGEKKNRLFKWPSGKNNGLGLALSAEILSLTGLSIREEGAPGQGVRFVISVPPSRFRYREEPA